MSHRIFRRMFTVLSVLALLTVGGVASASPAGAAPYCGITWGSLPKAGTAGAMWQGSVESVRWGRHACYDRLVIDVGPGTGVLGYEVRYVTNVIRPGSGSAVPVAGGARLQITVHANDFNVIPGPTTNFSGWRTFRQLVWAGSFEGHTDYGLGVRARLPMRAFVLHDADGGRRLVVDIAHRW